MIVERNLLFYLMLVMVSSCKGQQCKNGFTYSQLTNTCVRGVGRSFLWTDAEYTCNKLFGGHLISIHNTFQNNFFSLLAIQTSINGKVAIGFTSQDGDSLHWTDGTPANYLHWAPGEPDLHKHCAYLDSQTRNWFSTACDDDFAFICETDSGSSGSTPSHCSQQCAEGFLFSTDMQKCVMGIERPFLWNDAEFACSNLLGGHLVSISSDSENSYIIGLTNQISSNGKVLIGLTSQDGESWHWTDGSPVSFRNWASGEPDLNKHCAFLDASDAGKWISAACDDDYSFICEVMSTPTTPDSGCGDGGTTITSPTPPARCYSMDIIFVVDMSQSPSGQSRGQHARYLKLVQKLGSEVNARTVFLNDPQILGALDDEKYLLRNITNTFPNGIDHYGPPAGVQFAEVSFYDRSTDITFFLNDANNQWDYDRLIDKMILYTGDTNIDVALIAVRDQMLLQNKGYRPYVPTILMLFTDGNDSPQSNPIPIAQQLIARGINIFALYSDAPDSSPDIQLLRNLTGDPSPNNRRVVPLDLFYTLRQPFYQIIDNFITANGYNPCHPPVYADIVFVMDHSEDQVRAGEVGHTSPVDYVLAQKTQIKNIISQLGVIGHRYILAHFSDNVVNNPWYDPLSNSYRPKSGILFGPQDGYSMTEMFRRIDAFPELTLGGATNLKLGLDVVLTQAVPQMASKNDPLRLTYMVIFTTGFYDKDVSNCCPDPSGSASQVRDQFQTNRIIPVVSGKTRDRNIPMLLQYTGYKLNPYDVDSPTTATSVANTVKADIIAQGHVSTTARPTTPKPGVIIPNGETSRPHA